MLDVVAHAPHFVLATEDGSSCVFYIVKTTWIEHLMVRPLSLRWLVFGGKQLPEMQVSSLSTEEINGTPVAANTRGKDALSYSLTSLRAFKL